MAKTKILCSLENKEGWFLEDLLATIVSDLTMKNSEMLPIMKGEVEGDTELSIALHSNNTEVIKLLAKAKRIQDETMKMIRAAGDDVIVRTPPVED